MQVKQEKKHIRQFFLGLTTSNMHQLHAGNDVVCLTLAVRLMKPYVVLALFQCLKGIIIKKIYLYCLLNRLNVHIYIYIYIYIYMIMKTMCPPILRSSCFCAI